MTTPGPAYYDPDNIVCPCPRSKIYQPSIWYRIANEKRKKLQGRKHEEINPNLYCPQSRLRNIEGHGHQSVFKSKTFRLVHFIPTTSKVKRTESFMSRTKYFHGLNNPKRTPISFPLLELKHYDPNKKIRFNSLIEPKIRVALKINKNIAFGSTQSRFKYGEKKIAQSLDFRNQDFGIRKEILEKVTSKPAVVPQKKAIEVVLKSHRVVAKTDSRRARFFAFTRLPDEVQLFNKEEDLLGLPEDRFYNKKLNFMDFYRSDLVLTDDDKEQHQNAVKRILGD